MNAPERSSGQSGFRRWLLSLKPRADSPAACQKTPLGVNRFVLLAVYMLQVLGTGCVYFGWAPLSKMLLRNGAMSSECPRNEDGSFVEDLRLEGHPYICDEQDASVQHLFTITFAVHCTMSAFAGTMMDTLGPKFTSVLGQTFHVVGWSLLASTDGAGQSSLPIYLAFVFIGLGADTAFLPTLLITRLFPGSAAVIVTLLGSASSASFAVPLILEKFLTQHSLSGCWWYVGFGPGLFLVVDLLLMPLRAFETGEEEADLTATSSAMVSAQKPQSHAGEEVVSQSIGDQEVGGVDLGTRAETASRENSAAEDSGRSTVTAVARRGETENTLEKDAKGGVDGKDGGDNVSLLRTIFSERYILISFYFIGVSWASAFYQEAHDRLLSSRAQDFLGIILPFSFIPCVVLGKLADCWGILAVMMIVNASGLLAYAFALNASDATGFMSVICFSVYMSLFVSQVFVYVEESFPPKYFGRLIGLVQLLGGLLSLLCNPLFRLTVGLDSKGIHFVQAPMIALLGLLFALIARLWVLQSRQKRRERSAASNAEEGAEKAMPVAV